MTGHPHLTDEQVRMYESHGIDTTPQYNGKKADAGRIEVGPFYPGEGTVSIKCGGTEIVLGYTVLHNLSIELHPDHPYWSSVRDLISALDHIKCEASLGRSAD